MKTTKLICAISCAVLLAMSSCDNRVSEETNSNVSPTKVKLRSNNNALDYDGTLDELAYSLSNAINESDELRAELVNAFEGIGKKHLQLVDLVGLDSPTLLGRTWQNYINISLQEICITYPNIYLRIVQDISDYQEMITSPTTKRGGDSAPASGSNLHYAVVYRPLGTLEGEPFWGYENGDTGYEVSDVETDDHLLFVFEGSCYADEELKDKVKFIGQGASPSESGFFGITISIRINTPKSNCRSGFGLCTPEIKKHDGGSVAIAPDLIYIPYEEHAEYFELALAEEPNLVKEYVMFPIYADTYIEDMENQETVAYIEPKLYPFDPNIGDYGGFRIELTPYNE